MRSVPSLFVLDDDGYATPAVTPGCQWVIEGEGTATRKWNGVCVMLDGPVLRHPRPDDEPGRWWLRRTVPAGQSAVRGFTEHFWDADAKESVGWVPIEDTEYAEALAAAVDARCCGDWPTGTYELIGYSTAGNAEGLSVHLLMHHGTVAWLEAPRDYAGLAGWLPEQSIEGIVWWREVGDPEAGMAKLDRSAFPRDASAELAAESSA